MGMAASQARLLSLTSRQLDVELRSQVLQARKLQLANDSRRIYNNYLESLNESKIQYRYTNGRGESIMRDATLNGLQNGLLGAYGASDKVMFLSSIGGETLYVTPAVNDKYDLVGVSQGKYSHLNEYLEKILGPDSFAKVNSKNETTIKTPSNLSEIFEVKNSMVLSSDDLVAETFTVNRGYKAASNIYELEDTAVEYVIINNNKDLADYLNTCTKAYNDLFSDISSDSSVELQQKLKAYNKLLSMNIIITDYDSTFGEWKDLDGNLYHSIYNEDIEDYDIRQDGAPLYDAIQSFSETMNKAQNLNGLLGDSYGYAAYERVMGEVYICPDYDAKSDLASSCEEIPGSDKILCRLALGSDYHQGSTEELFDEYFQYDENRIFENSYWHRVNGSTYGYIFSDASNLTLDKLYDNSSYLTTQVNNGTFAKTITSDDLAKIVDGTVDDYCTVYNPKMILEAINSWGGNLTEEELDEYLFGNAVMPAENEPVCSNFLFQLNKSCELYLASRTGHLDECIDLYDNIQLQEQFEQSITDDDWNEFGPVLDIMYGKEISNYKTGGSENIDELFDDYFSNLLNDIDDKKDNTTFEDGIINVCENDIYFEDYYDDYDSIYSLDTAGEVDPKDYLSDRNQVIISRDAIFSGEVSSSIYLKSETVYEKQALKVDSCDIPTDYALANNIYMALVCYSLQNSDIADMDYNEVEKYKEIYTKIQGLDSNSKYKLQYLIDQYANWAQQGVDTHALEELYKYFEGSGQVPSSFAGIADLNTEDIHSIRHEATVSQSGSVEDVAKRYFAHYSDNFGRQQTYTIDTSNVEVQKAIAMYKLGCQYKNVQKVSEDLASNEEFVRNMVQNAAGILLTVDTGRVAATDYTYITEDSSWENDTTQKDKLLNQLSERIGELVSISDVNVATSTYLEMIYDSEKANEAQATYEADMATINRKETKIDNQLTQLEAERTAVKTEQDSVKNIVKENVDLTFKLFS